MKNIPQKTIRCPVSIKGTALHTGAEVNLSLLPAPPNFGRVFFRLDLPAQPAIPARPNNVVGAERGTVIGRGNATVKTTEHILAALYVLGIDNVKIELDGPEPPALDGSALPFLKLLEDAEFEEQTEEKIILSLPRAASVKDGDREIKALPAENNLRISFTIDYPETFIGKQSFRVTVDEISFKKEIAPARTYGFLAEVRDLWKKNLARGGSFENAIVITENGYSSELRFPDELVRHKTLDLLGDLALLPGNLCADIRAVKSGHRLNLELIRAVEKLFRL